MIVYEGQKYACLTCIRGHRSSSCDHKARVLLQIRKRGRRHQSGADTRVAIVSQDTDSHGDCGVAKTNGGASLSSSKYKVVHIHSAMSVPSHVEVEPEADDVHVTEQFVFIPVGNGLYRKEPRSLAPTPPPSVTLRTPSEMSLTIGPDQHIKSSYVPSTPSHQSPLSPASVMPHIPSERSHSSEAPMVIAPMDAPQNFFANLGLTAQEAGELWADDEGSKNPTFAPQCVMPGQCECGDGCECDNCYEHVVRRHLQNQDL